MNNRVLIICPDFYPRNTGYSNAFFNLITSLVEQQTYKIDVLTDVQLGEREELKFNGDVNVYRLEKKYKVKGLRFFLNQKDLVDKINELERDNQYKFLFMETFEYALVPCLLPDVTRKKFAVRIHGCYETERRFYYPSLLNYFNRFIVQKVVAKRLHNFVSTNSFHIDFAKEKFLSSNLFTICQKKFFVIPNTIDVAKDTQTPLAASEEKINFLMLGRMDKSGRLQKGFSDLLSALLLSKEELEDKVNFTIIGKGEYLESYKNFISENNLDFISIIEYEKHNDLIERMKKNDVVVLPSRYEGMSMFALEALATGNSVIFTDTGGLKDMCVDGLNGYSFEPQNIEELSRMLELIVQKKDTINSMKIESYKLYRDRFSPKAIAEKFDKMIQIITSGI